VRTPCRSPHPLRAVGLGLAAALLAVAVGAGCSKDAKVAAPTTTSTTAAPTPKEILATCSPAAGSDFVAIEHGRDLINGGQHLGQGFVSPEGPDGHYLSANVYSIDNVLVATALMWRISPDGMTAESATPETSHWDKLPDVPADQVVAHPELVACVKAALADAGATG
jgi:hypothetical protein